MNINEGILIVSKHTVMMILLCMGGKHIENDALYIYIMQLHGSAYLTIQTLNLQIGQLNEC